MLDIIPSIVVTTARFVVLSFLKIFKKYFLTWIGFEELLNVLMKQLNETNYEPTVIIGISGGGLVVADMIGKKYSRKIPVLSLPFTRTRDEFNVRHIHVPQELFSLTLGGQKVLLVDDCTITGSVMEQMLRYLNNLDERDRPKEIKTLVVGLVTDPEGKHIVVQPHYYAVRIPAGFKFPWGKA